jgi:hypothetical protein
MEFSMPSGQADNVSTALKCAFENAYISKAMRLKTLFTTKGVSNTTSSDSTNEFLDGVHRKLLLPQLFRMGVWMYYTCGITAFLMPEPGQPLEWMEILDPRMIRTQRAYGKTTMYIVADQKMKAAMADPEGRNDPRHRDYWNAMPSDWKKQLTDSARRQTMQGETLIRPKDGSYIVIENRMNAVDRLAGGFDGTPLQAYFPAAEQYRMLMAGQFSSAFLAKNILALVSVGDPKAEGDLYVRPDAQVLAGLQSTFQNPQKAMWIYGDPTLNVRYITPGPEAFDSKVFAEPKEVLKQLLPSPLWFSEGGGAFAAATVEMQALEEEAVSCQNDFDDLFWRPIHERAADGRARIAKKDIKPPTYDRSALRDRVQDLKVKNELYSNGGLDIGTLIAEHGYDHETIKSRLQAQMGDAKKGIYMPAFEGKQGIVATKTYGINKMQGKDAKGDKGKGGRPKVDGAKPQAESTTSRTPRPSAGKK